MSIPVLPERHATPGPASSEPAGAGLSGADSAGAAAPLIGAAEGRSQLRIVLARLRRDRAALAGAAVIAVLVLAAIFAPVLTWLNGYPPNQFNPNAINPELGSIPRGGWGGISGYHWLGVEPLSGRDLFSRMVYGARISLLIAIGATVLSIGIGTVVGVVAGYRGGRVDAFIGRAMDVLLSFPGLIFAIAVISAAPDVNRPLLLITILGFFGWPYVARVVRGQTLSLAKREFIEAARSLGAPTRSILFREILPNLAGPLLVVAMLTIPGYIAAEAGLSFLGIGVKVPTASWGQTLYAATAWYDVLPTYFLVPGVCLFVTVLAFNVLGDGLRDAFDPGGQRS